MVVNGYDDGSIKIDIEIDQSIDAIRISYIHKYARSHFEIAHHEMSQTIYSLKRTSRVFACVHFILRLFMFLMSFHALIAAHIDE